MRVLVALGLLIAVGCRAPMTDLADRSRPNIVVILADDMGYGDVRALNPDSRIPTPHLDSLVRDGVAFRDAHSPSAVCTPTRYGLLTGRYCWRTRLKSGVLNGYSEPLIDTERQTVASLLRSAGYATGVVGKWHLGLGWAGNPAEQEVDFTRPVHTPPNAYGFDASYIIPASLDFPPYVYLRDGVVTAPDVLEQPSSRFPSFLRKGERAPDLVMEDVLDHLTGRACEFVADRAREDRPFFLYFPLPAPHKPVLPHPRFRGATDLGDYGDFVAQVDASVGAVLAALDRAGVADDTLVIYTSDNGSFMYRYDDGREDHVDNMTVQGYRVDRHRSNGPWRGTKADIWEAGHRVPFLVRWPGRVGGAARDRTICHTDLMATFAALVGAELTPGAAEDSYSFLAELVGGTAVARPPVIHHSGSGMFAIRDGDWKLVAGNGSGGREKPRGKPFHGPFQLYSLRDDPGETRDLATDHPEVVTRLIARLAAIRGEH